MNSIAVIYKSKYGSTKKYAQWIAEEVKADLFEGSEVDVMKLKKYDTIVYGGGLYAGGIDGISTITKNYDTLMNKRIIVFTVGIASTHDKEIFTPIIEKNFTKEMRDHIRFFHLRGAINYKKLGLIHKSMMAMLKLIVSKKNKEELTKDDKDMLDTYGQVIDFTDKETIKPLLLLLKD